MISNKEAILVKQFNNRQSEALAEVYTAFYRDIYQYAYKILGQVEQAQDITADSFIKLWNNKRTFETLKDIKYYLLSIAHNVCVDSQKSRQHDLTFQDDTFSSLNIESSLYREITTELIDRICSITERLLTQKEKKIIKIILEEGLEDAEVAQTMNITLKTVQNHKYSAIRHLQTALRSFK